MNMIKVLLVMAAFLTLLSPTVAAEPLYERVPVNYCDFEADPVLADTDSKWVGYWSGKWGGKIPHTLVVVSHEDKQIVAYYTNGVYEAWGVYPSCVQVEGVVSVDKATFEVNGNVVTYRLENKRLEGEFRYTGGTTTGEFKRESPDGYR